MNPQQERTDAIGTHGLVHPSVEAFREASSFHAELADQQESSSAIATSQSPLLPGAFERIVNVEELMERVDDDTELLREIFDIFLAEYPGLHSALQTAVAEKSLPEIQCQAHALKGMLANLAVVQGAAASADIERCARDGNERGIVSALARLDVEMSDLLPCVNAYLAGMNQ